MEKNIGIYVGPYVYGGTWDENNLEIGGFGGSEIWAIELANEFVKSGDNVYIFGDHNENHKSDSGVNYIKYTEFDTVVKKIKFEHIITSRRVDEIYDGIPCDSIYLMCHDTQVINCKSFKDLKLNKINKICQQSLFQKEYLKHAYNLADDFFMRTYQAIDMKRYEDVDTYTKKNKMLFSSGKGRGSEWLVREVFPLIKIAIPDFELNICGYHSNFNEDIYRQDGINILGNISKDELVKEQKESKIWIYPNHGYMDDGGLCAETFSITAIENAVAKCACILGDWGCFHTTFENYKYFVGSELFDNLLTPMKKDNLNEFAKVLANEAIKCLINENYRLKLVEDSYNICKKYTWEMVANSFRMEWDNDIKRNKTNSKGVLLCCIGRMENEYIREYVEHYLQLGVNNICLYDNNYDGEDDFRDVISDYIDSGFVILKDYRNKQVCQLEAYNDCYKTYGNDYEWIMFFDIDEFMFLTEDKDIKTYLSREIFNPYNIIQLNWLIFGDDDKLYKENIPLRQRIINNIPLDTKIAYNLPETFHTKSIIRGGLNSVKWCYTPHVPIINGISCNSSGVKLYSGLIKSPFAVYDFKLAGISHYTTKTIEEYCIKMKRGFPDQKWDGSKIKELLETRFFRTNKITKEKVDVIFNELGIDMSYLLPNVFEGVKRKDVQIYSLCYDKKKFKFLNDEVVTPLQVGAYNGKDVCYLKDNTGDNISHANFFFIENTGTYWIWKNIKDAKYKGQMQYRRPLSGVTSEMNFEDIFSKYDVITCEPFHHPSHKTPTKEEPMVIVADTVEQGYAFSNCADDLYIMEMVIAMYYPDYVEDYYKYIKHGPNLYYSNGFIMKSEDYDRYSEFLFNCLNGYLHLANIHSENDLVNHVKYNIEVGKYQRYESINNVPPEAIKWQCAIGGFLSERLWTLWLLHNFKDEKIMKLPYIKMEEGMYT